MRRSRRCARAVSKAAIWRARWGKAARFGAPLTRIGLFATKTHNRRSRRSTATSC
jgi:hypothetical protein